MNENKITEYLTQLEYQTIEHQWMKENPSLLPQSIYPKSADPITLHASGCFDNESHSIHIKKHSDFHAGNVTFPHKHDFFEFNFICKGYCHNNVNGKEFILKSDTLLLMSPSTVHFCWTDNTDSQIVNLLVRPEVLENIFLTLMSTNNAIIRFFFDSLYGNHKLPSYMLFHINDDIMNIFWHMVEEFLLKKPLYSEIMLSDTLRLFSELMRIDPYPSIFDAQEESFSSKILDYIYRHYSNVSLEEVAEIFHYSPAYLSRVLKKETGKTFSEILKGYRLKHACNFLKNSDISAEKISEIIGYSNVTYFYKVFREEFQTNPSDYRRKVRLQAK